MDSILEEEDVSDPLKHLLSLDSTSSAALTVIETNFEPPKSVKRVRFSDEVEKISYDSSSDDKNLDVPLHEESGDAKNDDTEMNADLLPYSEENRTHISTEETEFVDCELPYDDVENTSDSIANDSDSSPVNSSSADDDNMVLQGEDDSFDENIDQNIVLVASDFENNRMKSSIEPEEETRDLSEVTSQVINLSLENSSSEIVNLVSFKPVVEAFDFDMQPAGNSAKMGELKSNSSGDSPDTSKRRAKSKSHNQKQSWKLNSMLNENSCYSNASELKTAVFKAWCEVKNKTKSVETAVSSEINISNKQPVPNNAYLTWKKSKVEARKKVKKNQSNMHFPNLQQEISKSTREEIEMAFKSWKKKKDEMLKQKISEKVYKDKEETVESLMEEKQKKMDAEAAFYAWKQHKSDVMKMEKKERAWMLKKKREEEETKAMRDQEALIKYHMWLESKSSVQWDALSPIKEKPPWIPPGK